MEKSVSSGAVWCLEAKPRAGRAKRAGSEVWKCTILYHRARRLEWGCAQMRSGVWSGVKCAGEESRSEWGGMWSGL